MRPFVDWNLEETSEELNFYSDASASEILGFGAVFNESWIFGQWEPGFIRKYKPSIEYLELFALGAVILTWDFKIKNKRVTVFTDNMAVVHMINNSSSGCKNCMQMLRMIVTNNIMHNTRLFAKHMRTERNVLADSLSRLDFKRFWRNDPGYMNRQPDDLPDSIWPVSKLWMLRDIDLYYLYYIITGQQNCKSSAKKRKNKGSLAVSSTADSSNSSSISIRDIQHMIENLRSNQHRDTTKKNYYAVWKIFNKFFVKLDCKPNNWEDRLTLFV